MTCEQFSLNLGYAFFNPSSNSIGVYVNKPSIDRIVNLNVLSTTPGNNRQHAHIRLRTTDIDHDKSTATDADVFFGRRVQAIIRRQFVVICVVEYVNCRKNTQWPLFSSYLHETASRIRKYSSLITKSDLTHSTLSFADSPTVSEASNELYLSIVIFRLRLSSWRSIARTWRGIAVATACAWHIKPHTSDFLMRMCKIFKKNMPQLQSHYRIGYWVCQYEQPVPQR